MKKAVKTRDEYNPVLAELESISVLCAGWDGGKTAAPGKKVIDNAKRFVKNLSFCDFRIPSDIEPTPYGSVVLNFEDERGLVSVEIGKSKIGWFTDFRDGKNYASDCVKCDFNLIPQALELLLA